MHPHLPEARGPRHELDARLAAVAPRPPPGAAPATVQARRQQPAEAAGANQLWSYDFIFDRCANGQQLKCLTVADKWTKEGLAIEVPPER